MTLPVTLMLFLAAFLLATWQAAVKAAPDKIAFSAGLYGTTGMVGLLAIPFVPPMGPEAWSLLAISILLHALYKVPMIAMYGRGDFSQVFPIARGLAPMVVTLAAIPAAGEIPAALTVAGVAVTSAGLIGFVWNPSRSVGGASSAVLAAVTGLLLSAYWVVDGIGSRTAGSGLTYAAWLFAFDGIVTVAGAFALRRKALVDGLRLVWFPALIQGILAAIAYALVLMAFRLGALGPVAAVGQTSIVFAALIGTFYFKEAFGPRRVFFASVVFAGIVMINAS